MLLKGIILPFFSHWCDSILSTKKHILDRLKRLNGQRHTMHCWLEFKRPIETCAPRVYESSERRVMAPIVHAINNEIVSVRALCLHNYKLCTMHTFDVPALHACTQTHKQCQMHDQTSYSLSFVCLCLRCAAFTQRARTYTSLFMDIFNLKIFLSHL